MLFFYVFFFFKQKTAYEMRISDWSSDVCSSDLAGLQAGGQGEELERRAGRATRDGPVDLRVEVVLAAVEAAQGTGAGLHARGGDVQALALRPLVLDRLLVGLPDRSEEHTSELQSLMRTSYAGFCLIKNNNNRQRQHSILI